MIQRAEAARCPFLQGSSEHSVKLFKRLIPSNHIMTLAKWLSALNTSLDLGWSDSCVKRFECNDFYSYNVCMVQNGYYCCWVEIVEMVGWVGMDWFDWFKWFYCWKSLNWLKWVGLDWLDWFKWLNKCFFAFVGLLAWICLHGLVCETNWIELHWVEFGCIW